MPQWGGMGSCYFTRYSPLLREVREETLAGQEPAAETMGEDCSLACSWDHYLASFLIQPTRLNIVPTVVGQAPLNQLSVKELFHRFEHSTI